MQRTFAGAILLAIIAAVCLQSATRVFQSSLHASQVLPDSFWSPANHRTDGNVSWTPSHLGKRPRYVDRIPGVYPYSVVPGGVKDPGSLRETAARDNAVSRHYAQFDYNRARIMRLAEPREVYVSYRIRDTIFWTHKKIRLPAGELLLTDGKITARAKCGNQISETAKPDVSDQEPQTDILDQPVALEPLAPSRSLRPSIDLPSGQPLAPTLNAGGFVFPYVSFGGMPLSGCVLKDGKVDKHCRHHHHNTPEPATIFLIASGLALILWRCHTRRPFGPETA